MLFNILFGLTVFIALACVVIPFLLHRVRDKQLQLVTQYSALNQQLTTILPELDRHLRHQTESMFTANASLREQLTKQLHQGQIDSMHQINTSLQQGFVSLQQQITDTLKHHAESNARSINTLTANTDLQLKAISGQVEKRLNEGFEKTNATFINIMQRLTIIDAAQQKITELSTNVVSLQNILSDKQARGIFGEVQLHTLISNVMPEKTYALQHTLSNGKRADCILFLPQPTGNVVIDAKFPFENFRRLKEPEGNETQRSSVEQQFRLDVRKHIHDISSKYILDKETASGAIMFIPAEAIFAEIHAYYPDLVDYAHRLNVWLASPTTLMAILTTARTVLKDAATRQQVHIIQEHLGLLAKDFSRFQTRMDNLAKHIKQAHEDVSEVNTSAKKITNRFHQIEQVELQTDDEELLPELESEAEL